MFYIDFRPDGWPLCPFCKEDELYAVAMLEFASKLAAGTVRDEDKPSAFECMRGVMRCYKCGWGSDVLPRRTWFGMPYVVVAGRDLSQRLRMSFNFNRTNSRIPDQTAGLKCEECGAPALTFVNSVGRKIGACGEHPDAIKKPHERRRAHLDATQQAQREFAVRKLARESPGSRKKRPRSV